MVQVNTTLTVADNSGAKKLKIIRLSGGCKRRFAGVGDVVTVAIKEAEAHTQVKKGTVAHAVIVRTRKETRRPSGIYIRFDDNAAILIDKKSKEMKGTRVFGPVARELRAKGFNKIISLAPEVL